MTEKSRLFSAMKLPLIALSCHLLAGFVSAGATGNEAVSIRLGTILPGGTAQYTILQEMGGQWRQSSGGAVKLVLYPDGRMGGEAEMVRKMRIKQLNACVLSVVGLSEIDPSVTGLQLMPLTFRSWDEVDYVREKVRPMLEQRLRAKGFEVLFWADAGWVCFFSKEPATSPDDFRKTKLFVWAGDERQSEIMKSIGYRPVGLETTDLLLGLNTNMITAVPLPPIVALAGQVYSAAPHMLDLNWSPIVGAAVIRRDVWDRLPPATQSLLRADADAAGVKIRAEGRREHVEAVRAMQERGLQVQHLTPEMAEKWQQLAAELRQRMRGTMVPEDIFDEVQLRLAEFRRGSPPAVP